MSIRNHAPGDNIQKKCHSIDLSHFEKYDIQHICGKFKGAPKYLQERLGEANVKRRQLLRYHERHRDKIAGQYDNEKGAVIGKLGIEEDERYSRRDSGPGGVQDTMPYSTSDGVPDDIQDRRAEGRGDDGAQNDGVGTIATKNRKLQS